MGAIKVPCQPAWTALSKAAIATTVLPLPTSPCTKRDIGSGRAKSFSISENKHWKMLEKEAKESHKKTKKLESQETSYDQFFLDYMDS